MLFNSFEFLVFLPVVWAAYWSLKNHLRLQNLLVVVASYVFYGWWDWRFLVLIAFTSAWSYVVGLVELRRWEARPSRALLTISLIVNLGILGYFKYFNFFVNSFIAFAQTCLPSSLIPHPSSLAIILPVGISFYTFQALSYTIDVYRRNIRPTRDPFAFFAFISFFPQLVAGPIERATNLLPQFLREKEFSYPNAVFGCRQMLWGFFQKMVVADNCAVAANFLLNDPKMDNACGILLGIALFALQVYGDFCGYSNIAIGCSRLFGISLRLNFAYPFFSRTVGEFWTRWHMSLMQWFRDYLYIPMGGGRCGTLRKGFNILVVFAVSGLWHGADWTFVLWGVVTALLFLPGILFFRREKFAGIVAADRALPRPLEVLCMLRTFAVFLVGLLVFRAQSVRESIRWFSDVLSPSAYGLLGELPHEARVAGPMVALLIACEWLNRREPFGFARYPRNLVLRWAIYFFIALLVLLYSPGSQTFVYFQF